MPINLSLLHCHQPFLLIYLPSFFPALNFSHSVSASFSHRPFLSLVFSSLTSPTILIFSPYILPLSPLLPYSSPIHSHLSPPSVIPHSLPPSPTYTRYNMNPSRAQRVLCVQDVPEPGLQEEGAAQWQGLPASPAGEGPTQDWDTEGVPATHPAPARAALQVLLGGEAAVRGSNV